MTDISTSLRPTCAQSGTPQPLRPYRSALAVALATLLLTGCKPPQATPAPETATIKVADAPAVQPEATPAWGNDDPNVRLPDPSPLGHFNLWEDYEGGQVCPIELENVRTIGGYTLVFDEDCLTKLKLPDAQAWFPAEDGAIVIIDATRKILVRLSKHKTDEYYAERQVVGLENLNLTRP